MTNVVERIPEESQAYTNALIRDGFPHEGDSDQAAMTSEPLVLLFAIPPEGLSGQTPKSNIEGTST